MEPLTLVLAALIVLLGNLVKAFFGFGGAFVSVPLLTLLMDIKFVVPVYLLFDLIAETVMCTMTRKDIRMDIFFEALAGLVIGTLIGVVLLISLSSLLLERIVAIIILVAAANIFLNHAGEEMRHRLSWLWSNIAGFFAGLFGAMFGMNGPPLAAYLGTIRLPKAAFRATIFGISFVNNLAILALYSYYGLMTAEVAVTALLLVPPLLLGLYIGARLHRQVDETRFRKALAALLVIVAIALLFR